MPTKTKTESTPDLVVPNGRGISAVAVTPGETNTVGFPVPSGTRAATFVCPGAAIRIEATIEGERAVVRFEPHQTLLPTRRGEPFRLFGLQADESVAPVAHGTLSNTRPPSWQPWRDGAVEQFNQANTG